MTTTLEVLLKARAEVEKGWVQHALDTSNGVCAIGGVFRVTDYSDHVSPRAAVERLLMALPEGFVCISYFNDHIATTKADVLALYDRAINAHVPVGDSAHVHRTAA